MRVIRLMIAILIFNLPASGQKTVGLYKQSLDSFMSLHLDTSILSGIECEVYMGTLKNQKVVSFSGSYNSDRDIVLENAGSVIFFYNYYSSRLNYFFYWYLGISDSGKIRPAFMLKKTFPECIQKAKPCNIITRDSAIRIAQADSIKFGDNCYVDFVSSKTSEDFYWVIVGVDKKIYNYNTTLKYRSDHQIPYWSKCCTRIIEASTGNLIPSMNS